MNFLYPYAEKIVRDFLGDNDFIVEKNGFAESMAHIEKFKNESRNENYELNDLNIFMGHSIIRYFIVLDYRHTDRGDYSMSYSSGIISEIAYGTFSKFNTNEKYKDILLLANLKAAKFTVIKFI